ncbi:MAG: hypothetical protein J5598_02095, partial [Clostridia bacterium]|nr:hypothetical protein [Clostridia bacterium]
MGIIIAAGALFTAVYDVLYRYNSSNTTNLNAAVSIGNGSEWGDPNYWWASGSTFRGNETGTMNWG